MDILVTGGSGTIGGYVLRELLGAGHCVTCYSRTAPRVQGATFIQGEIMDIDGLATACHAKEAVIHLAAVPGPGRATPEQLININVMGTVNTLEATVRAEVPRFVFASSGAATGFAFQKHELTPQYLPLDEAHPSEPQDEYGLSKLLAEITCKRYSDRYGLQTVCLRISNNWYIDRPGAEVAVSSGWAQKFSVEELWTERYCKTIENTGDWPVPGPPPPEKILWCFTDARDAATAFRLAVEKECTGHEVYLIAGDDTCSRTKSRELVAEHFPDVPVQAPLEGHATLWSYDKATRMLGYRPRYTWRASDFQAWADDRA